VWQTPLVGLVIGRTFSRAIIVSDPSREIIARAESPVMSLDAALDIRFFSGRVRDKIGIIIAI